MEFEINKERPSIIKVIGVGGGGSNAVNHMYRQGIKGVDFMVCNTDAQALEISPVPFKIQLGPGLTEGRGAGSLPEVGKNSAIENIDDLKSALANNTKMVFITAGMGGGTGTGAAPIIAGVAKEMGILTVGIVTVPFAFEGKKRKTQAGNGIEELKKNVDTLLIICNDKLREIHGDLKLTEAFGRADDILTIAAKSIAEIITVTGYINVDFADVQTVLKDSGVAIMGSANAEGENRALKAAQLALDSPLLNDSNITGARYILLNINSGKLEVTMDEIGEITDYIQEQAGSTADIIMGTGKDDSLGERIAVTVIATGFKTNTEIETEQNRPAKVVHTLEGNTAKATAIPEPSLLKPEPPIEIKPIEQRLPIFTQPAEPVQPEENHYVVSDSESTFDYDLKLTNTIETENLETESQNEFGEIPSAEIDNHVVTFERMGDKPEPVATDAGDQYSKTRERIMKLRELSFKFQGSNNNNISDLENVPAYKRRNIQLQNVPASGESQISRFTVGENEQKQTEIKSNNTFLHDRVD
ncbi:MAG: cell division protein FtsZ [Bacteroidia bacterium]|nr:cell division protein FtsZ [Bacteroidia bacterium]